MNSPYTPDLKNHSGTLIGSPENMIICPTCHSSLASDHVIYKGGKNSASPQFYCKSCNKRFVLQHSSINWYKWFIPLYLSHFNKPCHEHGAIPRYRLFSLPKFIKDFNRKLRLYKERETAFITLIENAFISTLRLIDKVVIQEQQKKEQDNWTFIINRYDSEKSYELDFTLFKAMIQGVEFLSNPDENNPLIHCEKCGSTAIIKNGYTGSGRRRFMCKTCQTSFVVRAEHLFTYDYVKEMVFRLIEQIDPGNITDLNHVDKINQFCHEVAQLFMKSAHMKSLTKQIENEFLISEYQRVLYISQFMQKYFPKHKHLFQDDKKILQTIPPIKQYTVQFDRGFAADYFKHTTKEKVTI